MLGFLKFKENRKFYNLISESNVFFSQNLENVIKYIYDNYPSYESNKEKSTNKSNNEINSSKEIAKDLLDLEYKNYDKNISFFSILNKAI